MLKIVSLKLFVDNKKTQTEIKFSNENENVVKWTFGCLSLN